MPPKTAGLLRPLTSGTRASQTTTTTTTRLRIPLPSRRACFSSTPSPQEAKNRVYSP